MAFLWRWHRRAFLLALWGWAGLRALWGWAGLRALGRAHYWRWLAGLLALLLLIRHLSGVFESERNYVTVFTRRNCYREKSLSFIISDRISPVSKNVV